MASKLLFIFVCVLGLAYGGFLIKNSQPIDPRYLM